MAKRKEIAVLSKLGDWSYSTYLCHWVIIGVAAFIAKSSGAETIVPLFCATMFVVVVASFLSRKYIEMSVTKLYRRSRSRDQNPVIS